MGTFGYLDFPLASQNSPGWRPISVWDVLFSISRNRLQRFVIGRCPQLLPGPARRLTNFCCYCFFRFFISLLRPRLWPNQQWPAQRSARCSAHTWVSLEFAWPKTFIRVRSVKLYYSDTSWARARAWTLAPPPPRPWMRPWQRPPPDPVSRDNRALSLNFSESRVPGVLIRP
jgi:hypothetical protein